MTLPLNPLPPPDRQRFVVCQAPPEICRGMGASQMLIQIANMDGFPPYPHQIRYSMDGALAYLSLLLDSLAAPTSAQIHEVMASSVAARLSGRR